MSVVLQRPTSSDSVDKQRVNIYVDTTNLSEGEMTKSTLRDREEIEAVEKVLEKRKRKGVVCVILWGPQKMRPDMGCQGQGGGRPLWRPIRSYPEVHTRLLGLEWNNTPRELRVFAYLSLKNYPGCPRKIGDSFATFSRGKDVSELRHRGQRAGTIGL